MKVKYFKTIKITHRFRENQKVWINMEFTNHLWIFYRFRGRGRWVRGTIDKFDACVGEIKEIDVNDEFAKRIQNARPGNRSQPFFGARHQKKKKMV